MSFPNGLWADSFQFYDPNVHGSGIYNRTSGFTAAVGRWPILSGGVGSGTTGQFSGTLQSEVENAVMGCWYKVNLIYLTSPLSFGNSQSGFAFSMGSYGDGKISLQASLGGSTNSTDVSSFSVREGGAYYFELHLATSKQHQPFVPATPGPPATAAIPEQYWITCDYTLRANEQTILAGTIDTPHRFADGGLWSSHLNIGYFQATGNTGTISDFYFNPTGELLGNVQVKCLFPAADSATGWTTKSGTSHYLMVNEHATGTTNYNYATSTGQEDSYTLDGLPTFTGDIKGVCPAWYVGASAAGAAGVYGFYGSDAYPTALTEYPTYPLNEFLIDGQRLNPATGVDWTQSDISSLAVGIARST